MADDRVRKERDEVPGVDEEESEFFLYLEFLSGFGERERKREENKKGGKVKAKKQKASVFSFDLLCVVPCLFVLPSARF